MSSTEVTRHARAWLDARTWRSHLRSDHDEADLDAIARWVDAGRPLVVKRRDADTGDAVPLAIKLPLSRRRRRIALAVAPSAIVRVAPPLTLAEAIASAPAAWRARLQDLVDAGGRLGTTFHVYGSLAWQAFAGEHVMTPESDIDLLWSWRSAEQGRAVLALLQSFGDLPLDGEALLADGAGVAWRELAGTHARVLAKSDAGVAMRPHPLGAAA